MTTTPPPMPHEAIRQLKCVIPFRVGLESPDDAPVGNLRVILESAEKAAQEVEFCCAQWMERITSLEADRKMLWESLTQTTRLLGELVAKDAQTYAPYMRVIDAARTALENTK